MSNQKVLLEVKNLQTEFRTEDGLVKAVNNTSFILHRGETLGIVGSVIGIAGGIVGTVIPIRRTKSPAERRFMIRAAVVCWAVVIAFLAIFFWLQRTSPDYAWVPWAFYPFILFLGIRYMNKRQLELRGAARRDPDASE